MRRRRRRRRRFLKKCKEGFALQNLDILETSENNLPKILVKYLRQNIAINISKIFVRGGRFVRGWCPFESRAINSPHPTPRPPTHPYRPVFRP